MTAVERAYEELRRAIVEAHDFLGKPERIDEAYVAFLAAVREEAAPRPSGTEETK